MTAERIPLPLLPRELKALTGQKPPGYRAIHTAVLDSRIPAERGTNGRWTVARADLPAIAAVLSPSNEAAALAA